MKREHKPQVAGGTRTGGPFDHLLTQHILEGIDPENVRHKGNCCTIALSNDWPSMLGALPELGEALVITGNPIALLGSTRIYPELMACPAGARASSQDGSFDMEFVPWESARVVAHSCQGMAAHYLEFADCTDTVIHRLCLTEESNREHFVDWVQTHQASGREAEKLTPFPASRWHTVQQRHWFDYEDVVTLDPAAVLNVLHHAMREQHPVNVVVGNEGVVQGGEFVPRQIHDFQKWTFASNDTLGLHFDLGGIADTVIHRTLLPGAAGFLDALKCFDDDGALRLAIKTPGEFSIEEWNRFLDAARRAGG